MNSFQVLRMGPGESVGACDYLVPAPFFMEAESVSEDVIRVSWVTWETQSEGL